MISFLFKRKDTKGTQGSQRTVLILLGWIERNPLLTLRILCVFALK